MRRVAATTLFLLFGALVFGACKGEARVVDVCDSNKELCIPCKSDAECRFTGNPCTEVVYCAHRDAAIATVDLGCSEELEYSWPDDEECQCNGKCIYNKK